MLGHAIDRPARGRAASRTAAAAFLMLTWAGPASASQDPNLAPQFDPNLAPQVDPNGPQVLSRGPIHEAFASPIAFNPTPGPVVPKAPPQTLIEEQPPDQKPVGADVEWIPGYWGWDDERDDFLWISGVWRDIPPGRQWVPGYWSPADGGFCWTPGFWGAAAANGQFYYLPAPPPTQESGPNSPQPGEDFAWAPGTWLWQTDRYVWRPGYWFQTQPDWIWVPSSYAATPSGYVYNEGYWDYSLNRRGLAFAPVAFAPSIYSRPSYSYSPSYAIPVAGLISSLFVRPSYNSYYFGDYYGRGGGGGGLGGLGGGGLGGGSNYIPWFDYGRNRNGFDPLYASMSASRGGDVDWDRRLRQDYQTRVETVAARPPAFYNAQRPGSIGLVQPFRQWASNPQANHRFVAVADDHRADLVRRQAAFRDVAQARQRQEFEARSHSVNQPFNNHRANEIRNAENQPFNNRANEVRNAEVRNAEIRNSQNRNAENRPNQNRNNEIRREDIRPDQFRPQRIELPRSPIVTANAPRPQNPGQTAPPAHPEQHQNLRPNFDGVPHRPMAAPGQGHPEPGPGLQPRPPHLQPGPGIGQPRPPHPQPGPGIGQPMPPHLHPGDQPNLPHVHPQPQPQPPPGPGQTPGPGNPRPDQGEGKGQGNRPNPGPGR